MKEYYLWPLGLLLTPSALGLILYLFVWILDFVRIGDHLFHTLPEPWNPTRVCTGSTAPHTRTPPHICLFIIKFTDDTTVVELISNYGEAASRLEVTLIHGVTTIIWALTP